MARTARQGRVEQVELVMSSVHYPEVVPHYRSAHDAARRAARGASSTEDLRQALVHYRALFQELLHRDAGAERAGVDLRRKAG